ncbi:HNH endonuclease [Nocardiopsis algeriensis]|uniref:HNH endonuclease n=1 Tax=Nocardiopsis algeriensis TaxID=1478215 RepID=UPI003B431CDE
MIRLHRTSLPDGLQAALDRRTQRLHKDQVDAEKARKRWNSASDIRKQLRAELSVFAAGLDRCMYCGENVGTDVDHFEPIVRAPLRTYDWFNHLLACSRCNSQAKGFVFPCDAQGKPLLIDPTVEDPYDHLELSLSTGRYLGRTAKGSRTIEVLQLNRAELELGRERAFIRATSMLRDIARLNEEGHREKVGTVVAALCDQPFADVLHAMLRLRHLPGAQTVLDGPEVVHALELVGAQQR